MRCQCERCAPIAPGPTYTEAHRLACEVRVILSRPLHTRREYLEKVEKARGKAGREYLESAIRAAWDKSPRPMG